MAENNPENRKVDKPMYSLMEIKNREHSAIIILEGFSESAWHTMEESRKKKRNQNKIVRLLHKH